MWKSGSYTTPVSVYTSPPLGQFNNLSVAAKNSAVGIFCLKAVFSTSAIVLNVRNGITSATTDIYADSVGNLTTISGQTLVSWLSGATGYITTWYDQSPVGNHATQVDQVRQPKIDFANNQVDFKTSCYFDLPDGTVPSGNSDYTMIFKHNTIGSSLAAIIHSGTQGTQNFVNSIEVNTGNYLNFWWANDIGGGGYEEGTIFTAKYINTTGRTTYKNGTQTNSDTQTTRSSTIINNFIAKDPRDYYLNGELYHICLFNTALSNADRNIVENLPINIIIPTISYIKFFTYVAPPPSLYSFSTFTFTPMGATGASGPTTITYGGSTPGDGTPYVMTLAGGIQYWTVPSTANYTFTIAGGAGGAGTLAGGQGAIITVTLSLTAGDVLKLLVGQQGTSAGSGCGITKAGGGGGSFVYNNTTSTILIVAGGGGGGAGGPIVTPGQRNASLTTSGKDGDGGSTSGAGGTAGGGGEGSSPACTTGGGGGGGFTGNGTNGVNNGVAGVVDDNGGLSFMNGGTGGTDTNEGTTYGGFGGAGAAGNHGGGGGGGYSGGGGGGLRTCDCGDTQVGGGGGSYATVSFTSSSATNTGDGYITITKL